MTCDSGRHAQRGDAKQAPSERMPERNRPTSSAPHIVERLNEVAIKLAQDSLRDPIFKTADDNMGRAVASAIYRMHNSEIARCFLRLVANTRTPDPVITAYEAALTPSEETKAAYMGEFKFSIELSHPRLGSESRPVDVPWTTIKEIMAAIKARAALAAQGRTL